MNLTKPPYFLSGYNTVREVCVNIYVSIKSPTSCVAILKVLEKLEGATMAGLKKRL